MLRTTRTSSSLLISASRRTSAPSSRTLVTIVKQGREAWRLTLGQSPTRLQPGLHLNVPLLHDLRTIDLRETSSAISDLTGFTSDNVPVVVSGSLFWRVNDSYRACFAVGDYEGNVRAVGTSAMRSVVGHFTYDEVIGDRNKINAKLREVIGRGIEDWGISCTRFEIQNVCSL
jgi:regulator of protease activity HflC (stomatin/prohibitin superfamily)